MCVRDVIRFFPLSSLTPPIAIISLTVAAIVFFFRSYTGVKHNLSSECLFHSNGESGTPCQRYSLHHTKGQDPAIGLA